MYAIEVSGDQNLLKIWKLIVYRSSYLLNKWTWISTQRRDRRDLSQSAFSGPPSSGILLFYITNVQHFAPDYTQGTAHHEISVVNVVFIPPTNLAAILLVLWRHTGGLYYSNVKSVSLNTKQTITIRKIMNHLLCAI